MMIIAKRSQHLSKGHFESRDHHDGDDDEVDHGDGDDDDSDDDGEDDEL